MADTAEGVRIPGNIELGQQVAELQDKVDRLNRVVATIPEAIGYAVAAAFADYDKTVQEQFAAVALALEILTAKTFRS